ncbi:MAG: protein phosphatase 2C domain-containing protein [Chloroflexi bacterium]|nr:protein phosphatase 2C domain-containing protein [Chloroflexota bacterium]
MIKVRSISLTECKAGNKPQENEDAFFPEHIREEAKDVLRLAVSDGATEGMLSLGWAHILTRNLVRRWPDPEHLAEWLDNVYGDWAGYSDNYKRQREVRKRPIKWYEEPGLEAGAFATLIGVSLFASMEGRPGRFEVAGVGDSCIFLVREDALVFRFPFLTAEEFNNQPVLLASNCTRKARALEQFQFARGDLCMSDRLYLMTDALAAWFVRKSQAGYAPWRELDKFGDRESFSLGIKQLRETRQIRNDDMTLTRVSVIEL